MTDFVTRDGGPRIAPRCLVDGCPKSPAKAAGGRRGWCQMHYRRWLRHGDPLLVAKPGPSRSYPEDSDHWRAQKRQWWREHRAKRPVQVRVAP